MEILKRFDVTPSIRSGGEGELLSACSFDGFVYAVGKGDQLCITVAIPAGVRRGSCANACVQVSIRAEKEGEEELSALKDGDARGPGVITALAVISLDRVREELLPMYTIAVGTSQGFFRTFTTVRLRPSAHRRLKSPCDMMSLVGPPLAALA
jgi:hypothetical protein